MADPDLTRKLERLARAGIQLIRDEGLSRHFLLQREGFACLVERTETGFGSVGSAGLLTGDGFGALVQRGSEAFFRAKGYERRATPAQIEALRRFADDVKAALG